MDWTLQHVCEKFNTNLSAAANPSVKLQLRNSQTFTTIYQIVMQEEGKKKQRQGPKHSCKIYSLFYPETVFLLPIMHVTRLFYQPIPAPQKHSVSQGNGTWSPDCQLNSGS